MILSRSISRVMPVFLVYANLIIAYREERRWVLPGSMHPTHEIVSDNGKMVNAMLRYCYCRILFLLLLLPLGVYPQEVLNKSIEAFKSPPPDCYPRTRWWWMGNCMNEEDITWQLEQMREHGIRGVEQITMEEVYQKGDTPYLSDRFLELIQHTVREAKRLDMKVSLNFGGPGWVIGGEWVPPEDRSQNLLPTSIDLKGTRIFNDRLPVHVVKETDSLEVPIGDIDTTDRLVAVVAGRVEDGHITEESLVDLTERVVERKLEWEVPEGQWRLMAFWLKYTGQGNALDHFNRDAMIRYCDVLGGRLFTAVGDEFGKTVDSLFCDSFEVALVPNGIYWSEGLLTEFERRNGYDLTPYLPAVWWEVDSISPKIRCDVNHFLHQIGLEAFFEPFLNWCETHGVQGRIQPYGFPTDILQGAGMTSIPEMEITAGEKDAVPWFDTRIGPKKYVASGAHLYGRKIVSTEAYTYLHWDPYRETMEELKIAGDNYFRSGCNLIYNHGYIGTPERDIAPSRGFYAAIGIDHRNVWWRYYPLLSVYQARSCYLLRQGQFTADVAIYSPLANQWTLDVRNPRKWTRGFDWGHLGKLLIGNGYDFDLINDDVLLNYASIERGILQVRDMRYRILILPAIKAMPLESLKVIAEFVRSGGVAIALERVPDQSTGFHQWEERDAEVRNIVQELFREPEGRDGTGPFRYGDGWTYHIKLVMRRENVLDWRSSVLDPFVNTLREHLPPDFGIDFVRESIRENPGLTFVHRRMGDDDIYFIANLSDRELNWSVDFRVSGKIPWEWNPYTGGVQRLGCYDDRGLSTRVPLRLAAYTSTFIVFERGKAAHVMQADFPRVEKGGENDFAAYADTNGSYQCTIQADDLSQMHSVAVNGIPAPFAIAGEWKLVLEGKDFERYATVMTALVSWTETPATRYFSGTGHYELAFLLPDEYVAEDLLLWLDLGDVGNIAEVNWNGADAGVIWMRGQKLNVTPLVKRGENRLQIDVTNTSINRVSGWKAFPPVPAELLPRLGGELHPNPQAEKRLLGFEPLPRSGLLGPVRLVPMKKIWIDLSDTP